MRHDKTENSYRLITEPQAGYQPVYDFISAAEKIVDMTMYQLSDPNAQAALISAAKRGVKVRVLLDSDPQGGGGKTMNQAAYNDLQANGVNVKWAWSGTLWHQKSILRDGSSAAVMTCNLYAPYYPVTRDFAVITDNHATASGMEATFNNDWNKTEVPPTKGVVPRGSELIWSPGAQAGLVNLIDSARPGTTLYAEDEQLDSAPIEQALVAAAKRRVTVNLTMTYSPSYVEGFNTLAAGRVHVHLVPAQRSPLHPCQSHVGKQQYRLCRKQQFHDRDDRSESQRGDHNHKPDCGARHHCDHGERFCPCYAIQSRSVMGLSGNGCTAEDVPPVAGIG